MPVSTSAAEIAPTGLPAVPDSFEDSEDLLGEAEAVNEEFFDAMLESDAAGAAGDVEVLELGETDTWQEGSWTFLHHTGGGEAAGWCMRLYNKYWKPVRFGWRYNDSHARYGGWKPVRWAVVDLTHYSTDWDPAAAGVTGLSSIPEEDHHDPDDAAVHDDGTPGDAPTDVAWPSAASSSSSSSSTGSCWAHVPGTGWCMLRYGKLWRPSTFIYQNGQWWPVRWWQVTE
jgi:hypothetical protein